MSKKIYYAFVATAVIIIGFIFWGISSFIYDSILEREEIKIKNLISSIALYSAENVGCESLEYLIDNLSPNISQSRLLEIESSREFATVLKKLKSVQSHFDKYCTYLYVIYPINEKTYYVIGADSLTIESLDSYGEEFDIEPFPVMKAALAERRYMIEPSLNYDPQYKIYSISAYAPVYCGSRFVGLLGLDLQKSDFNELKKSSAVVATFISIFGLTCMVLTTLFITEKLSIIKRH